MKSVLALSLVALLLGVCLADVENPEGEVQICTMEYNPLCASNGRTYANDCEFRYQQKKMRSLSVLGRGTCDELAMRGVDVPVPEL